MATDASDRRDLKLDEITHAIYLSVPGSQVVMLQAVFETYEGIGTVRTIDIRRSLICIITTTTMLPACWELLDSLHKTIPWNIAHAAYDECKDEFLGYGKKGQTRPE